MSRWMMRFHRRPQKSRGEVAASSGMSKAGSESYPSRWIGMRLSVDTHSPQETRHHAQ